MPSKGIPPSFTTRQILAWCKRLALWFMCLTSSGLHSKYPVQFVEWVPGKKGHAFHREISEAKRNSPSSSLSTPHSFLWSIYTLFASLRHNGSSIQRAGLNKTGWIWPQSSAELKGGKAEMVLRKSVGWLPLEEPTPGYGQKFADVTASSSRKASIATLFLGASLRREFENTNF